MVKLFVDMDGTIATWDTELASSEILYQKGYFNTRPIMENMLEAVKLLSDEKEIELFMLTSIFSDSVYTVEEKHEWLDTHLPHIPKENRIFAICGESKRKSVPFKVDKRCYLLDDYTKNLYDWSLEGKGIKVLNGINHTKGSWKGPVVEHSENPLRIASRIKEILYKC